MRSSNLSTLGAIARIEGETYAEKLITVIQPLSPVVEAYRVLRTNLQYSELDRPVNTLMVTSPNPGEGKSITLANLAVVMAQSGLRIILVDTDLRRPVIHEIFNLPNRHGLCDATRYPDRSVVEHLQTTGVENLRVLTSGPLPPNPAELLGSQWILDVIEKLKSKSDVILFDSPPVLAVADSAILGARVDGVLLVNDVGRTRRNDVQRAVENLQRVRVNLLGVVLNRQTYGASGYYYNYYGQDDGDHKGRAKQALNWLERVLPFHRRTTKEPRATRSEL
jgi:capsular exopolysaccharide synthesis family protein